MPIHLQGRSQELEMGGGGAKWLGEGSTALLMSINITRLYLLCQWSGNHLDKMINKHIGI